MLLQSKARKSFREMRDVSDPGLVEEAMRLAECQIDNVQVH